MSIFRLTATSVILLLASQQPPIVSPPEADTVEVTETVFVLESQVPPHQRPHAWVTKSNVKLFGFYLKTNDAHGYEFLTPGGDTFTLRTTQMDHKTAILFSKVFQSARQDNQHANTVRKLAKQVKKRDSWFIMPKGTRFQKGLMGCQRTLKSGHWRMHQSISMLPSMPLTARI